MNSERAEWLERRKNGIGASDAAAVIGASPYKTNVQLWEEKTGRRNPPDVSDKHFVKYGTQAEEHLRALFALDFPEYRVDYDQFGMIANCPDAPFAFATLDGKLAETSSGRSGVLEIKTTGIMRSGQYGQWKGRIPQHYYIQVLHQLLATGFEFACLKAQIKFNTPDGLWLHTNHYWFERSELEPDIEYLKQQEINFWNCVITDKRPDLILPDI